MVDSSSKLAKKKATLADILYSPKNHSKITQAAHYLLLWKNSLIVFTKRRMDLLQHEEGGYILLLQCEGTVSRKCNSFKGVTIWLVLWVLPSGAFFNHANLHWLIIVKFMMMLDEKKNRWPAGVTFLLYSAIFMATLGLATI